MINSIIFDWGGVIAPSAKIVAAEKLAKKYNYNSKILWKELKSIEAEFLSGKNSGEFFSKVRKKFDIPIKEIRDSINDVPPNKEIVNIMKTLKKEGFALYLLSDQMDFSAKYIRNIYDLNFFNQIYFSSEIHLTKSSEEIFEFVLNDIKQSPEECLFVDDDLKNIWAAQKLGINTIYFENFNQFKKELFNIIQSKHH